MKYHTLFLFRKLGTMSQNLSSAAFVIGALKVYSIPAIHSKILSRNMRFPTMWYVQPAKAQTSLRLRTV